MKNYEIRTLSCKSFAIISNLFCKFCNEALEWFFVLIPFPNNNPPFVVSTVHQNASNSKAAVTGRTGVCIRPNILVSFV
jgi:hypothetical protein